MKLYTKKQIVAIIGMSAVFMLIASFYDLAISKLLYDKTNSFGILLSGYGQLPAMLCLCVGSALLVKNNQLDQYRKKRWHVGIVLLWFILNGFVFVMLSWDTRTYIPALPLGGTMLFAALLIVIVNAIVAYHCPIKDKRLVDHIAWFLILTPALTLLLVNLIKLPWGRPRMRLLVIQPQLAFRSWWEVGATQKAQWIAQGIVADEFKSFPSAHTACAACAMAFTVLPYLYGHKEKKSLWFIGGLMLALLVGLSRIIAGAHFLSDITIGLCCAFFVELFLSKCLFKG